MRYKLLVLVLLCHYCVFAQKQTVGIFLNSSKSFDGYTLLAAQPHNAAYLIDNCGRIVHTWPTYNRAMGNTAYMLDDGSLMRITNVQPSVIPGVGGRIERIDWEGNLVWEYQYSDSFHHQHHDIEVLPNGNVLLLAYESRTREEASARGRQQIEIINAIWPEHIVEIKPEGKSGGKIVWEWHVWDHLIQDISDTLLNYGKISDHPELVNINYTLNKGHAVPDWLHGNAVAYNPELDQIVISARSFSELWVIDHTTTSAEAASHKGGKYGKGGDILYRWGNPEAYGYGDSREQQLFFQHDVHWIPKGLPGEGHIMVFNNGPGRPGGNYSSIVEIVPPLNKKGGYNREPGKRFLPEAPFWEYKANPDTSFFSSNVSGARRLPNGNTIIVEGAKGNLFEVDTSGEVVWRYVSPISNGFPVAQGDSSNPNAVFRVYRYPTDHPAFKGKKMEPKGYVESSPGKYDCELYKNAMKLKKDKKKGQAPAEPTLKKVEKENNPNPIIDSY